MADQLVPSSAAEFPGSFAPAHRSQGRGQVRTQPVKDTWYLYFTNGWDDISVWKSAFIEFVGSASLCYLSAMIHITIGNFEIKEAAAYVAVTNVALISLFIYGMAPASGGHVNQLVTFSTMVTGLTGFSRGMLYLVGQTIGAALAGGLIRGSFGESLTILYQGGGCFLTPDIIPVGRAYLIESVMSFIVLFLSFGVGLDPRQGEAFGPKTGPLLVACSVALVTSSSVGLGAGYPGASGNPGRCFAFAIARRDFQHQWIWWLGPLSGALAQGATYRIAPPYHREIALARTAPI